MDCVTYKMYMYEVRINLDKDEGNDEVWQAWDGDLVGYNSSSSSSIRSADVHKHGSMKRLSKFGIVFAAFIRGLATTLVGSF